MTEDAQVQLQSRYLLFAVTMSLVFFPNSDHYVECPEAYNGNTLQSNTILFYMQLYQQVKLTFL